VNHSNCVLQSLSSTQANISTNSYKHALHSFTPGGAPHTHTLIWIENFDDSTANLDNIISAEIPPQGEEGTVQRELYDLVTNKMIHGPCSHGWACWNNGYCSKKFPFVFNDNTIIGSDYYPQYRRRSPENGATSSGKQVDNRNVVPYNAYLLLKYRAHINVQYVVSIASTCLTRMADFLERRRDSPPSAKTAHGMLAGREARNAECHLGYLPFGVKMAAPS